MSDNCPSATCSASTENQNQCVEEEDSNKCVKLKLDYHISANLNKISVDTEVDNISGLIEKVFLNYIIVKQILSNLSWQEKLLCEEVCRTWYAALQALKKEQLNPEDFVLDLQLESSSETIIYKQSQKFYTEPLVVMIFANDAGFRLTRRCQHILPHPCAEPCNKKHSLLDVVNTYSSAPKDCINMFRCEYLIYMPLSYSETSKFTITHFESVPFIGGLYIPAIPDVEYHVLNLRTFDNMKEEYCAVVNRLTKDRVVKGLLVFVTDKYLLHPVEDIVFLKHLNDMQKEPYAFGGCIIDDTVFQQSSLNDIVEGAKDDKGFISENLFSMGFFTIPKTSNEFNFNMYSLIISCNDMTKAKIHASITEFSKKVPQFEHSVGLKFSCVGRDSKHLLEQNLLRDAFPNTIIVGCYGNGELGLNCPAKVKQNRTIDPAKRQRLENAEFDILFSYSTVFVYIGWGKVTK